MTLLPLLIYEVGILGFYLWMGGNVSINLVHKIAWAQDLALFLLPPISIILFVWHCYNLFIYEDISRVSPDRKY